MDELDHITDATLMAQDALLADLRRRATAQAGIQPPLERECDSCGCDIPAARLKLRPTTRLCVDCQAETEVVRR